MAEPIWKHEGYVGFFGDAYVAGTELENGHLGNSLLFLQLLLKKVIERGTLSADAGALQRLTEVLAKSVSAAQQVVGAKKLSELLLLLKTWTQLLSQLALREQLLAPGGWRGSSTNWVVFLVERISQDMYSFTVCNRGPAAAQYHPTKFIPDGLYGQKMKIQATLTFQVHRQHLCDPGFWAMAFGQWVPNATEYHRAEVLYDVLLPWLAGVSFGRLTEKLETPSDEGRWRTPCRSNTSCMKNLLEGLRHCALRQQLPWRSLLAALRREAMLLGAEELSLLNRSSTPQAQAAMGLLAAYRAAPPPLRPEQLPRAPAASCQVIALFFSVPNVDELHRRLSELVTAVWATHGGGSLLVCEAPLGEGGEREWPRVAEPRALAKLYGLDEEATEPKLLLFRANGQLQSKEGLQMILKDPRGRRFPWPCKGLDSCGAQLLLLGARSLAKRSKESRELGRLAKAVQVLVSLARDQENIRRLTWRLPQGGLSQELARGELLRQVEVEAFAGPVDNLSSTGFVDFCSLPLRVSTAGEAVELLVRACELVKAAVRRSREASVAHRLALEMETIAFISSVTLDSLPVPREGADDFWSSDLGADERSAEAQKKGLKALLDLASLYAFCWQSLERAQRAEDSERLLAVSQMLCVFDALLRRPVPNGTLLAELLKEDGGMSFHLGLCGDLRPLTQVLQRVELLEPRWLQKRREILAYFTARESATRHRIFDFRMVGSGTFEVRKYSSTMALLRKVLERKGLELIPRDGPPVSEMEALMEWLFGRGQLWEACPEMYWCRDMAMLFKFLGTMEPRSTELLRKRRDTNEYQFWRLTFDGDMASRPGFGWRQDVPAIHWEVQGVRGADQDIADLTANAFGRELTLGEGLVVQSPADVGKLLERPNCTEEDVLHAARLPTFEETLSPDEAEALMSFLTVPYLQLPLVLDFFASQDRAAYLFNPELQRLLRAVLFEPRAYQEGASSCSRVPARGQLDGEEEAEKLFGTPLGLLLSDLCYSPQSILEPLLKILQKAEELGHLGDVKSSEAPFLLFMLELASDILRFVDYAAQLAQPSDAARDVLREAAVALRDFTTKSRGTLARWSSKSKDLPTTCAVHGYLALEALGSGLYVEGLSSWCLCRTWHNFGSFHDTEEAELSANQRLRRFLQAQGIDTKRTSEEMLNQFTKQEAGRYRPVFLRVGQQTVRVPNFRSRDSAKCALCVPEARVFREIQSRRPQIIAAFQESPSESLTRVCSTGLRSEVSNVQWSHKGGGVFLAGDLQLSVQTGELLWREDGLKPLPDSMTRFEDFETIFGDASLQCGVVCRTQHRLWVHLVGRSFDLMEWSPSPLAAFKQGAGGPQEAPSSARCGRCGQSNGCWQCERCTMINCKLETSADSCVACGGPSPGGEESGPPLGPMGFGRGARRPKVQPVTEGVFLGERFSRPLDLYADEGPSLPDPESWLLDVLVPVLLELFPSDPEDRRLRYQLLLPEKVSSANDTEIRLLGFDHGVNPKEDQGVPLAQSKEEEQQAATWKEVLVSKTHEVVLVFNLVPHGRRFYRSLVFTSKSSLGLHNLPLDTPDAQKLPGAAGSFGEMRRQEGSLCIRRLNKELDKLGENYVSPRLLRGVVPSALLENYSFWEGEDGLLRGEPSDDQSTYFSKKLQIELQGGASPCTAVRFRITRLATAKFAPPTLPPEQREWRGLRPPELARGAVGSAARSAPVQEAEVLQLAELGFPLAACRLALQESGGSSARAAEWLFDEGNTSAIFAAVEAEDAAMAVDEDAQLQEALLQSEAMECDEAPRVAAGEPPRDEANAEVDGPNLLLLDLFAAEEGSQLASLCQLLLRIEDLSHVLAWAGESGELVCVELPRLKLTLLPKEGSLEVKDAGGWFVKSEEETSNALAKLREGLEQALLIENAQGDLRLLLPNHDVTRPLAKGEPFSTRLIFNRSSFGWQETMDFPYYLYPVHGTQTFLQATSLAASLYLSLLCLLSRDYAKAFAELDNCWTDVPLLAEEKWVFNQFANSLEDQHPDAHAVRCKLALSVAFVEDVSMPMELHLELDQYLAKRHHVSRGLWLNEEEELQLLRLCKSSTRRVKARLEYLAGKARGQVHVTLRADPALHGGQPWSRLNLLPREELRRATHVRRLQFRHPQLPEGSVNQEWPQQVDGEALVKMIWTDELLQDDESGVNRSLGFVFLYMVLLGQLELKLNDVNVTESLGGLLTRLFHLKLARWGKELQEEGESDVQLSHQMATLALLARGGSIAAGWPPVPSDAANRSALAKGQNLYDAIGRESPLKMWLDQVDQIFHQILNEAPRSEAFVVPETWAPKMELQVMLEELELRRRGRDDRCARLELPSELRQHAGQEILAHLDLNAFVSWTHEAFQSAEPFDLSSHPCTRTSVAQNLLKRLAEDCQRYAEICAQRRTPVVCGFDPAQPETCAQRLEELEQALRASAREDGQRTLEAIETMLADANGLPESEEVFDFKLQRDLCRLEQHVTFDYAMSCIVSSKAQEDLLRLNPYLTYKASAVLCHALAVTLLSGRQLQARRAAELALRLARRLRAGSEEVTTLQQELSFLGELLTERRCYIRQEADQFVLDPRFLLFEFMQHIVLRPRQVEMVDWFMQSYKEGESRVQQMIMGAGKTTVVGPLLSTMLSQPDVLVTQVMPSPLLDQSRQILRASFSKLMPKRIVTFQFDRQVDDCPETIMKIYTKLEACRRACGIVVSSPESIKSMLLKFIEQLHALASYDFSTLAPGASVRSDRELARQRDTLERRSGMADAVVRLIQLWKTGIVIMDEVDVLLHPLKSELNFPIGFRDPIDLSGHRWNLPIHLVEGILFAAHEHPLESSLQGSIAQEMAADPQHAGHELLRSLKEAFQHGFSAKLLQRTPHAVLLDVNFYQKTLKHLLARWILLWLKKNFTGGSLSDEVLLEALVADQPFHYKQVLESGLTPFSLKLFNLASTWIGAILPHVLAKIDRVSYGLLSKKQLEAADEKTPFSRLVMAVPFVGKDVPSRSSEFAHPDVAIGLTILAYRFEGLRPSDVRSIVAQLKQDGARQLGPRDTRPAHVLFESWVRQEEPSSPRYKMRRLDEELSRNILPLSLFQPTDPKQMARLYRQIQNTSEVAHFWLRQHVFPVTMNFHPLKISASGHELGSSLLFGYRLGFSGTPSNLLPEDLGECFYEPGSDGQVTAVLTDPKVTSAEVCEPDWSPLKLLERVAQGQFHALIDTGALITNMDNEQVARELLAKLPPQDFDGVVFLDPSDRKMILLRGSSSTGAARAVSLVTSGVVPERRFTFFDQVHTTGMDILAAPCAKAVLTVGKDMNFRDYAQGAFRMRKVGKGQCIHLLVIPEVQTRIVAELGGSGQLILDVPKWLLLNSCRSESLQSLKLLAQELSNGWRKQALQHLCSDVIAHEKMPPAQRMRRFCSAEPLRACLRPFQDQISFKVEDQIIAPRSYRDTMKQQCDEHWPFSQEDLARQTVLLERIAAESQVAEHQEMHQGFAAEVVHEQEQEQQQEQEEEQEEEQENAFTRDDEQANPWRAQVLSDAPKEEGEGERPFYRLCHFRARPEQPQLPLDDELWLSDNFFRPSWVGLGERRLKTASVLLEWHPEISQARQKRGMQKRVRRIFEELQQTGVAPTEAAMKALMKAKESIRTEPLTPEELAGSDEGHRYLVLVTLAEAETLRWLARSSSSSSSPLRDVGFALRSLGGRPLEASAGFVRGEEKIDRLLSLVRLFNCEMFFTKVELETLEAQLHEVPLHLRQNWFEELLRLRRRRARFLWLDTPVAKLFTPQEEWKSLRAQSLRCALQRALRHFAGPLEDLEALLRPMSPDALGQHLLRLRLGFAASDVQDAVNMLPLTGGMVVAEEAFEVPAALAAQRERRGLKAAELAQAEAEHLEKAQRVWSCRNCTFMNSALSNTCAVCDYGWTGQRECPSDKWCCSASTGGCTFFNPKTLFYCEVCGRVRPDLASMAF